MKQANRAFNISLKARLVLLIEGLVIVVVLAMSITATIREKQSLEMELRKRGVSVAEDLARFVVRPLINEDVATLRRFVLNTMAQDYVRYVIIIDPHGRVVMHSDLTEVGKRYEDRSPVHLSSRNEYGYTHPHQSREGELHCDIFTPIKVSAFTLGTVALGYSHSAVEREIDSTYQKMFFMGLSITVLGGVIAYVLATFISSPIVLITTAVKKVANGERHSPLRIKRRDEIGVLASSFDQMARDLARHRKNLENIVKERTEDLARANERLREEIAERKITERELISVKTGLQHLLESSPVLIYSSDPRDNYSSTFISQNVKAQLGYEAQEVKKDPKFWTDRIHPQDAPTVLSDFERGRRRFEYRFRHKDGSYRWLRDEIRVILDDDKRPLEIVGCIGDITAGKELEHSLRESEGKYRALFEESRDAIYIASAEGLFVDVNQSAVDLFRFTRADMIGMDVRHIYVDPNEAGRFQRHIKKNGSATDYEVKLRRKDGTQIDCLLTASVRRRDGQGILGHQGIIRDISQQKQLEKQLQQAQKMEAIGTLAGGIAHDFNNILQGILGYSQLLMIKEAVFDEGLDYLKQIDKSAQKGAELVRQLMIFSRKVDPNLRPLNLNHEIVQADTFLRRTIPRMIDIELSLAGDLKIINGDSIQLEQIIMNLIVNAKDAMPDGGKITLKTENVILDDEYCKAHVGSAPGEYVLLSISDNGDGIDGEILEHIFEPFYTTKKIGKGTGLGLAMVYGIVKNHGGCIDCLSTRGQGTVFNIYFPVLVGADLEEDRDSEKAPEIRGGHETILFVDDEETLRNQGRDMLTAHGYRTITAETGERAIEIYKKEKDLIDLVVIDLGMPGMGGFKCMLELIQINPEIKVIVSSGYGDTGQVRVTLESGAAAFVAKPFSIADMMLKIRNVLDQG